MIIPQDRFQNWYLHENAQIPTGIGDSPDAGPIDAAYNWAIEHTLVPVWNALFSNDGFRNVVAPVGLVAFVGVLLGDFVHGLKSGDDAAK